MTPQLAQILFGGGPNPVIDLNFAGGTYQLGAQRFSDPTQIPGWAFTRASLGRSLDGTVGFGSGVARIVPGYGYLSEETRTNLFLNSSAPVTQNVTITTTTYVVTVWGSGSVAVSAGTATATGYGTATDGSPVTIVCTGGGTIVCTVTGTPTYVQVEAGTFGTSPIVTAGTSAVRAADVGTITNVFPSVVTLYAQAILPANNAAANKVLAALTPGVTTANRYQIMRNTGGNLDSLANSGGGAPVYEQTTAASGALTAAGAISHDGTTYRGAGRGVAYSETAAAAPVGAITILTFGLSPAANTQWVNGYLKRVLVLPYAMSTAQMQALTA